MKQSAKAAVRSWREFIQAELGPDWQQAMREQLDRDKPEWRLMEFQAFCEEDKMELRFAVLARGGFEGESLPDGPPEGW